MCITEEDEKKKLLNTLLEQYPIDKDVTFNEFDIQEKLKNHAFILMKYQRELEKVKYDHSKILELKEKIVCERYQYYRFNYDEQLSKPEIEKYYLPGDEKILKINKVLRMQDVKVNFFEICVRSLDKQGWNMKNYIETHKMF